jgi:hypothetical protein
MVDEKKAALTAEAFLAFLDKTTFDQASLRSWERETLSSYLGLHVAEPVTSERPPEASVAEPDTAPGHK